VVAVERVLGLAGGPWASLDILMNASVIDASFASDHAKEIDVGRDGTRGVIAPRRGRLGMLEAFPGFRASVVSSRQLTPTTHAGTLQLLREDGISASSIEVEAFRPYA
jgi:hypothetical protein